MSIPFHEWFFKVVASTANTVPIQSLWVAFFTNPACLNRAIQVSRLENAGPLGFASLTAGAGVNTGQSGMGALFANSVTIPGDGMNASKLGSDGMGPIRANISDGRKDLEDLTLSFLDTNISFCDYNLRPWAIYATHKSLKDPTTKTTITVMQLMKSDHKKPLLPRAIWTFHGACPVSIESQQWTYQNDVVINRQVSFAYNYYTLNADPGVGSFLAVKSIFGARSSNYSGQPITVPKGGLTGHGSSQIVTPPQDDNISLGEHPEGQPVTIPQDDMIDRRAIALGLDIINGQSNVQIPTDSAINRLKSMGEEMLDELEEEEPRNDTPSTLNMPFDFVDSSENALNNEHQITRRTPEREQSGSIPVGGNSKQQAKDNSDTPLFFPGDGEEDSVEIGGRRVDGELDTPEIQTMTFQEEVVEPIPSDIGKMTSSQLVNIDRDTAREGGNVDYKKVVVDPDDVTDGHHGEEELVTIDKDGSIDGTYGTPKIITVNQDDVPSKYGVPRLVQNESSEFGGRFVSGELDDPKVAGMPSQLVEVEKTGDVGRNIPMQIVKINKEK